MVDANDSDVIIVIKFERVKTPTTIHNSSGFRILQFTFYYEYIIIVHVRACALLYLFSESRLFLTT